MTVQYAVAPAFGEVKKFKSTPCYYDYWDSERTSGPHIVSLWVGELDDGQLQSLSTYVEWLNRYFKVQITRYDDIMKTQANQFKAATVTPGYAIEMEIDLADSAERQFVGLNLIRFATDEFQKKLPDAVEPWEFIRLATDHEIMGIHMPYTGTEYYHTEERPELYYAWFEDILNNRKWGEGKMGDSDSHRASGITYSEYKKFVKEFDKRRELDGSGTMVSSSTASGAVNLAEALDVKA